MTHLLSLHQKPTFWLGVNYWSRVGGPRMWDRFDAVAIRKELNQLRQLGLNVCRSFIFIPSFMPHPPLLSSVALDRFFHFLDLCQEEGMPTIPSFLVGHMSGENYGFPGQDGRSPYTDPEIVHWEKELISQVLSIAGPHPAVAAYLASNEMPFWGGPADPMIIVNWAQEMRQVIRQGDACQPFGLGDGVMNIKGGQNGFDVHLLAQVVDFLGPHTYYTDADPLRQAYNVEFCLRSLTYLGLPVVLEEFGCSASQASEENQALYFREAIHACLGVGAAGALPWCFSDLDLADDPPYTHHAFELGFGITRADGEEKPVCDELRRLARLIHDLDYAQLHHPRPKCAILVPAYYNTTYPFSHEDRSRMHRVLLQAYVLAAEAGLEAELIPEGKDLSPYTLILIPSTQKLLAKTWSALHQHATRGHTIYWSYYATDDRFCQGMWCHLFEELTGCRHQLRYGGYDQPDVRLVLHGGELALEVSTEVGTPHSRSFLPIMAPNAEVVSWNQHQQPALTRRSIGQGQVFFLAYPLEYYLAEQLAGNRSGSCTALYRLLAERAGLPPAISCLEPGVQTRIVESPAGSLLWLINHNWEPVTAQLSSPAGNPLYGTSLYLQQGENTIYLSPKQVAVFRLSCRP